MEGAAEYLSIQNQLTVARCIPSSLNLKDWEKFCNAAKKGRKSAEGDSMGLTLRGELDVSSVHGEDEAEMQRIGAGALASVQRRLIESKP
jgi:hypothetical protein